MDELILFGGWDYDNPILILEALSFNQSVEFSRRVWPGMEVLSTGRGYGSRMTQAKRLGTHGYTWYKQMSEMNGAS